MSEEIKRYWDERAREAGGDLSATTQDIWMRELEVRALSSAISALGLPPGAVVADIGCGDGNTLMRLAADCPDLRFRGYDYAAGMVEAASARLAGEPGLSGRVDFEQADATRLDEVIGDAALDVVTTDRCLINLTSPEAQANAIAGIARTLKPGGHYFAIENFIEGQDALNAARDAVGLDPIAIRWHNLFFTEPTFREAAAPYFDKVEVEDFSSAYYYATRVIYSKMCRMEGTEPDYNHPIHQLAIDLPPIGAFSPIKFATLRRRA